MKKPSPQVRPQFIALEGRDGVGKSVQIPLVADSLRAKYYVEVQETKEPGATDIGEQIKNMILNSDTDLNKRARLLLFAADNAQHATEVVLPALEANRWVLSDRSLGSALAYQGFGFGFGTERVNFIYTWATSYIMPDITVLLDCDDSTVAERLEQRGSLDNIEKLSTDFHHRVRDGYRQIASLDPSWVTVDANGSIDETTERIVNAVDTKLAEQRW